MTITNTTRRVKQDPMSVLGEILCCGTSHTIERQESQGQRELVKSEVLPTRGLRHIHDALERAGGAVGNPVDGDPMFTNVTLPPGWGKQATDHSMWSRLIDQAGRERASIFYKAAFYDRDAFIQPSRRFTVDGYSHKIDGELKAVLRDAKEEIQRETEVVKVEHDSREMYEMRQRLSREIEAWLDANYPDWKDPSAYWE